MKRCELCKSMAKVYCDSDRAILCWSCDAKVHSANFLVARHSRNLLCQLCHSPTPWSASGEKLLPSTASICVRCVVDGVSDDDDDREERVGGNDGVEIELEDSVDENDSQVVPWSSPPPPPASSSSAGEELFTVDGGASLKRKRQSVADLTSEDCSSVNKSHQTPSSSSSSSHCTPSCSVATVGDMKKIRRQERKISGEYKSATVVGRSKSTRIAEFE